MNLHPELENCKPFPTCSLETLNLKPVCPQKLQLRVQGFDRSGRHMRRQKPLVQVPNADDGNLSGGLSKLWSLFGSPKLGPVLGPVL